MYKRLEKSGVDGSPPESPLKVLYTMMQRGLPYSAREKRVLYGTTALLGAGLGLVTLWFAIAPMVGKGPALGLFGK